jgi:CDP-4-dehydro-6-deoxyglucose reductase, E3
MLMSGEASNDMDPSDGIAPPFCDAQMPPSTFDVRVVESRMLSPTARELVLERADGRAMLFSAGQSVCLTFPSRDGEMRRWYSIASSPDCSSRFSVAMRISNTPLLHDLPVGATLGAFGPKGVFTRPPWEGAPSLFVGTGTGIAPLRSMIESAIAHGDDSPLVLLVGVRHQSERLYADDLRRLEAACARFRVHYTLSQQHPDWSGLTGYVQDHVPQLFQALSRHGAPHVYVCGSVGMVAAVNEMLRNDLSVSPDQIHGERYD